MTDVPLPEEGDTSWGDWAAEQEELSDAAREILTGRLTEAALDAAYGGGGGTDLGIIAATDYGVAGDGSTNDGPEIQAALDAAGANGGGTVMLSRAHGTGVYVTNQQLIIPDKVELVSDSRETIIRAGGSFPTSTALIRLGSGAGLVFGSRVRNLTLDCNAVAGSTGVYSTDCNEQSGVFNAVIYNFKVNGVHFVYAGGSTNPSIVVLRDLEVYPAATGATYGVLFDQVANQNLISGITTGVNGTLTSGIRIVDSQCQIQAAHTETCTNGIEFASGSYGSVFGASGHPACTNVVRISATNARSVIAADIVAHGSTNLIVDDYNAVTIPATVNSHQALPFYSAGETYVGGMRFKPEGGDIASALGRLIFQRNSYGEVLEGGLVGDSNRRWVLSTDGELSIGSGAAARDVIMYRSAANVMSMAAGDSFRVDGTWNGGTLRLGAYHLWVDATGDLRIKGSAPTSDTDGTVVGTQT